MFLSALIEIQNYLKASVPGLKKCERYKGEFEDEGNWTPDFPCALWRLDNLVPSVDSERKICAESVELTFHVADKNPNSPTVLNMIENISALISSTQEISGADVFIRPEYKGATFKGYRGGVECYVVLLSLDISAKV